MGTRCRDYQPEQPYLLPPSPRDGLAEGRLAYYIADTLQTLELSALHRRYAGDGRRNQPDHPEMLLEGLIYAYATGVFSSRKIARKLDEDIAFRVPAAGNRPDFRTINRFRGEHLEPFTELFVKGVRPAKRMGLVKLGTVALAGTKIQANAGKHKAMSYRRMQEDERRRREQRPAKIRAAQAALEAEQAARDREQGRGPDDETTPGAGYRRRDGRGVYQRRFGEPGAKAQRTSAIRRAAS